jgi:hypothetical protein
MPTSLAEISAVSDARRRKPLRGTPFWHDGMQIGSAIMAVLRDNISMRQLQFFTRAEVGRMRDRTASRNHSPERDEFRRLHAHHRAWGLVQRHGRRLHRLRTSSCPPRPARTPDNGRQDGGPARAPAVVATPAAVPASAQALAVVPASVSTEQRKRSTPAACEQRRAPASNRPTRNQPTRDQHVSASQQPAPPPPDPGPAVPPARPNLPPLTCAGCGTVRSPGEAATRKSRSGCDNGVEAGPHAVVSDPDRPAPESSPPTASRGSGHDSKVCRPKPRPPWHRRRQARKWWQASRSTPIRTR